jgi:hypothetical protein
MLLCNVLLYIQLYELFWTQLDICQAVTLSARVMIALLKP